MLALTTTTALTLIDTPTLKRAPATISPCHSFSSPLTALAWSQDNSALFIASGNSIHQHDLSGSLIKQIYPSTNSVPIKNLLSKDASTLLFSIEDVVHFLASMFQMSFRRHNLICTSSSSSLDGAAIVLIIRAVVVFVIWIGWVRVYLCHSRVCRLFFSTTFSAHHMCSFTLQAPKSHSNFSMTTSEERPRSLSMDKTLCSSAHIKMGPWC
jgi:hypothetical protein